LSILGQYSDTITYRVADARKGSQKLLKALTDEYDYNVYPPAGWKPRKIEKAKPTKQFWFEPLEDAPMPKIGDIKRATCKYFGISAVDLVSARRSSDIVHPRQIAMYLAATLTTRSLPEIGRNFGGRDHTTVLYAKRKIDRWRRERWLVAYDIAHLEATI
jgi:chromosomal replication initiation ATPase DnaA